MTTGLSNKKLAEALRELAKERAARLGTPFWGNLAEALAARWLEAPK